jgi:hypothetical protein
MTVIVAGVLVMIGVIIAGNSISNAIQISTNALIEHFEQEVYVLAEDQDQD